MELRTLQYKVCSRCESEKPTTDFWSNPDGRGGLHSMCKSCKNEVGVSNAHNKTRLSSEWFQANKEVVKQRLNLRRHELIIDCGGECVKCGYSFDGRNGAVFHFHHRNPEDRLFGLSQCNMSRTAESVAMEVEKCDLLCANCHILTHNPRGE